MLTFKQLVNELTEEDATLSPAEILELQNQFGKKALQMGHLQADGSMLVPVDCVLEAARALGMEQFTKAVEYINNEQMVSLFKSAEDFVERVIEARRQKLELMVEDFQSEPDDDQAHQQWKAIEKMIFGIEYKN